MKSHQKYLNIDLLNSDAWASQLQPNLGPIW